jgi:hypothetical protein
MVERASWLAASGGIGPAIPHSAFGIPHSIHSAFRISHFRI